MGTHASLTMSPLHFAKVSATVTIGESLTNIEASERLFVISAANNQKKLSLLDRLIRNEPAAVAEVYDQHQAAIRAFARRLVGDEHAACDLVHEVFITLPKAIQRFKGECSLRTFLISIAINHARHYIRSATRRRAAMERYARHPKHDLVKIEPHETRIDLSQILSRALDELPLEQRVAFVLCDVEERTSKEAAEIVGSPEATIRTRVFHARKRLREILEREGIQ